MKNVEAMSVIANANDTEISNSPLKNLLKFSKKDSQKNTLEK